MGDQGGTWIQALTRFSDADVRRVAVGGVASQILLVVLPGYALFSYFYSPQPSYVYWLLLGNAACGALGLELIRRGKSEWSSRVIVGVVIVTVCALVLAQGLHGGHLGAFHPALVATGLLMSARATLASTVFSAAVVLVTSWLHRQGYYGPAAPLLPDFVAPIAQILATGGLITFLMYVFTNALQRAERTQHELELSQAQLRRAEKMDAFGQLAGGVAHDFNNILTGMLGHIDLLRMQAEELDHSEEFGNDLAELERSAGRASGITKQLLAFSRKETVDGRVSNIASVLEEADPMLRSLIREDVEFRVISEVSARVRLPAPAVEQVLMNLVINANDAMPRGGALAITTIVREFVVAQATTTGELAPGTYVCFSVSDSGEGISGEELERIFEPFFTTKPVGKGTGLGLSTVLGVVQRAGGQISVESSTSSGTTFHVYLPFSEEEVATPSPTGRTIPPPSSDAGVLLLCEDDTTILKVMSSALRSAGYEVHASSRPEEALAKGIELRGRLTMLITDVIMPSMNGRELAEALEKELGELPVLFISGYTAGLLADLGMDASDHRMLNKPFAPKELVERVREVLSPEQQK